MLWNKHIQTFYFLNQEQSRYVQAHFIKLGTPYYKVDNLFKSLNEYDLVIFERGLHDFEDKILEIRTNNIIIDGNNASLYSRLVGIGVDNVTIKDLEINKNSPASSALVGFSESSNIKIMNVTSHSDTFFTLFKSSFGQIVNCSLTMGSLSVQRSNNVIVRNNNLHNYDRVHGNLISIHESKNIIVSDNRLSNSLVSSGRMSAINVANSDNINIKSNYILNSSMYFNGITRGIIHGNLVFREYEGDKELMEFQKNSSYLNKYNSFSSNLFKGGHIHIRDSTYTKAGYNLLTSNQMGNGIIDEGSNTKQYNNKGGVASVN